MTIPNALTLIRILLTPLLVWLLLGSRLKPALIVFLIAGVTDGLDGLIARLFHQKTKLGAYLDPLADKLLLVSSFILLGYLGQVPAWLVVIVASRDAIILLGILTLMFHNVKVDINPSVISKLTTFLQIITIIFVLGKTYAMFAAWVYVVLFLLTAGLSIASGLQYTLKGFELLDARRTDNHKNTES